MAKPKPYIPKSDPNLPDNWGVTVHYLDGKEEQFEVIGQIQRLAEGYWEFQLANDIVKIAYIQGIRNIDFSKEYRAVMEAKARAEHAHAVAQPNK